MRVGIVEQRYGQDVVGGAETLVRQIAERLAARGLQVVVYTTTARDYITWANHYRAGVSLLKGVMIKRFQVARERRIEEFNRYSDAFFAEHPRLRDENAWIFQQGPFCPSLLLALQREQHEIDVFIFFTYLYYPTVQGIHVVNKPVILFPQAHDEAPLYLGVIRSLFARPQTIFVQTQAEFDLVQRVFTPAAPMLLVRPGLDIADTADDTAFRATYAIEKPYLLYAGRIERGKGLEKVFEYFSALRQRHPIDLILIGKSLMAIPAQDGIRYLGFVSESDKLAAFRGALASLQPSPLESLSITTLESFSQGTPVLVNRQCQALLEHVELSGGGFAYDSASDFLTAVDKLLASRDLRRKMGDQGYAYVRDRFSWSVCIDTFCREISALSAHSVKLNS